MNGKTQFNQLSRFAAEIPDELIDCETPPTPARHQSGFVYGSATRTQPTYSPKAELGGVKKTAPTTTVAATKKPVEKFAAGDTVIHQLFGEGVILTVRPMGGDVLYEVVFETAGTKKLMGTYAKLKKK